MMPGRTLRSDSNSLSMRTESVPWGSFDKMQYDAEEHVDYICIFSEVGSSEEVISFVSNHRYKPFPSVTIIDLWVAPMEFARRRHILPSTPGSQILLCSFSLLLTDEKTARETYVGSYWFVSGSNGNSKFLFVFI